jgi:hypothetical protein
VAEKKKRNFSPESRQKLSDLAKQRHAEGKLGGAEFGRKGGRATKRARAAQAVAEAAQDEVSRRRIINVFRDAVDPNQPMGIRMKGATEWLAIEREEGKLALQESEVDAKNHSREELLAILAKKLTNGPTGDLLRRQLEAENIPDAEVVEEETDD